MRLASTTGISYRFCEPGDERPIRAMRRGQVQTTALLAAIGKQCDSDDALADCYGPAAGTRVLIAEDQRVIGMVRIVIGAAVTIEAWTVPEIQNPQRVNDFVDDALSYLAQCGLDGEASVTAHVRAWTGPSPGEPESVEHPARTDQYTAAIVASELEQYGFLR